MSQRPFTALIDEKNLENLNNNNFKNSSQNFNNNNNTANNNTNLNIRNNHNIKNIILSKKNRPITQ